MARPKRPSKAELKATINAFCFSDLEDGGIEWADTMVSRQGLEAATDRELRKTSLGAGHADGEAPEGPVDTGASPSLPTLPGMSGSFAET